MELTKGYLAGFLDQVGCFYLVKKRYLFFYLRCQKEKQKQYDEIVNNIRTKLKINIVKYKLKKCISYHATGKDVSKLITFMKNNCYRKDYGGF